MSSKVVDIAVNAADIPISEKNQWRVADEEVEDIFESSTARPANIDEMGLVEKSEPPTAGTLDIDEMVPPKNKYLELLVLHLTLTRWVPLKINTSNCWYYTWCWQDGPN